MIMVQDDLAQSPSQVIYVRTFGAFSLSTNSSDETLTSDTTVNISGRGRRIWSLIAYLIIHHDREVPVMELIDILWSEDDVRDDPLKTLQHNVSRARDLLQRMGLPNARELIVSSPGGYRWNSQRELWLDLDELQMLQSKAKAADNAQDRVAYIKQAVELYRGDFLPGLDFEAWVTPISAYTRSLYVNLCLQLTRLLSGEQNLPEITTICERALRFAPESEELTIRYIRALTAVGSAEKAITVYENACKMMYERLGVVPSSDLVLAYEEARQAISGTMLDIEAIRSVLTEQAYTSEGLRCDWNSFLSLVRREARNARRAKREAIIMVVSMHDPEYNALNTRRIEIILARRLRTSDVYTRLNANQFLALLPEAGYENAKIIAGRIISSFETRFPNSTATVTADWYSLTDPSAF